MEHIKSKSMKVQGNKIISIDTKLNEEGYLQDHFGNTLYKTDSAENIARLAAMQEEAAKPKKAKTKAQKVVAPVKKAPRKKKS
jgi:hypothetical protein